MLLWRVKTLERYCMVVRNTKRKINRRMEQTVPSKAGRGDKRTGKAT